MISRKRNIFFCLIIIFSILFTQTTPKAEDQSSLKTFEAIGNSRIQGTQIADAREAAISSALLGAVDRATIEMITIEVFSRNFSAITEITSANVKQFVHGYKVLAETRTGGYYRIMVQATVSLSLIQKQLSEAGILLEKISVKSAIIEIQVEGAAHLKNYSTFRSALNKIEGVKSVQVKEMKANKATLIVDYQQDGRQLADSLILITFDGFGINVPEVTHNNIKIILLPGQ